VIGKIKFHFPTSIIIYFIAILSGCFASDTVCAMDKRGQLMVIPFEQSQKMLNCSSHEHRFVLLHGRVVLKHYRLLASVNQILSEMTATRQFFERQLENFL
jgi:hypothetical protein